MGNGNCLAGIVNAVLCGAQTIAPAVDAAQTAVAFGSDPFGYIAQKMGSAITSLSDTLLPALAAITQPDLSAAWFLGAYKVSFALSIFGWILILLWELVSARRGGSSSDEVFDSFAKFSPMFLVGAAFGPAIGTFVLKFIGALNASLVGWGLGASAEGMAKSISRLVTNPDALAGGSTVAILIFALMLIGLLATAVVLIVMLVTLYLSGIVLPLSLMWLAKAGQREKGRKVLLVWGGVLLSQPLMFLLLGAVFSGVASNLFVSATGQGVSQGLQQLVTLIALAIAMLMAALGPAGLLSFAPVLPSEGSPSGPRVNAGRLGGAGRGGAGASSPTNSQMAQIAGKQASGGGAGLFGSGGAAAGGSTAARGAAGAAAGIATGGALLAAEAGKQGVQSLTERADQMKAEAAQQGGDEDSGSEARPGSGQQSGGSSTAGTGGRHRARIAAAGAMASKVAALAQQAGDHASDQMDHQHTTPSRRR